MRPSPNSAFATITNVAICMARDRSRLPAPPLAGLLHPGGTVTVPAGAVIILPAISGEVLRFLNYAAVHIARDDGVVLSQAGRQLLGALYQSAEQYRRALPPEAPAPGAEPVDDDQAPALTVREAAARMGCTTSWVRQLLNTGKLPGRRTTGGTWLVLATSQVESAPAQSSTPWPPTESRHPTRNPLTWTGSEPST